VAVAALRGVLLERRGLVKVRGKATASLPKFVYGPRDGSHKLPIKAELLRAIPEDRWPIVRVQLEERIGKGS